MLKIKQRNIMNTKQVSVYTAVSIEISLLKIKPLLQ